MKRIVRIRNSYSDRNKIREIDSSIQYDDFSKDTRIILKNEIIILLGYYEDYQRENDCYLSDIHYYLGNLFAKEVFNLPLHGGYNDYDNILRIIYITFDDGDVCDILDFLEYFANNMIINEKTGNGYYGSQWQQIDLFAFFNGIFSRECIGYRFIDRKISKITNEMEISEIEQAIAADPKTKIGDHIKLALEYLSDRNNPNYKDSIAQSVKALEGLAVAYYGRGDEPFDKMIKDIKEKHNLHPKLESLLKDIYHYASDNDGIRHVNSRDGYKVTFDEAKMILVIVSSVVNYFATLK